MRGCVGAWVRGCVGSWVRGCVGAWVRGCVRAWVRGCVGAWVGVRVWEDMGREEEAGGGGGEEEAGRTDADGSAQPNTRAPHKDVGNDVGTVTAVTVVTYRGGDGAYDLPNLQSNQVSRTTEQRQHTE